MSFLKLRRKEQQSNGKNGKRDPQITWRKRNEKGPQRYEEMFNLTHSKTNVN